MSAAPNALRILVVEDEPDIRELLVAGLAAEGPAEVEAAADGQEALRMLAMGPRPSVILLDLRMPVLSGEGVLRVLAEQPGHPPVVTMSACTRVAPRGASAHLDKPFTICEALSALHQACGQASGLHPEPPGAISVSSAV